jgi:DNA polymerase-1
MEDKKLFLLDAYALIFRAYYALIKAPRVTSKGLNTSAIFGFVTTIEELLRKEKPSHLAVCFDPQGPTFRHKAYEAYKGEREATPEDIRLSIPYIKRILEAYNIPIIEVPGFEADDVIGTMARKAEAQGFTTYMMTPDKDFGQLVTDKVLQYKPAYKGGEFEIRGVKEVCEKYGISNPLQVIDLLALMGDKVDNIPGCPGVGEKTAAKLIGEFGSVEELVVSTDKLKGALKKKVEENVEQIKFSKFLATIKTDVEIEATPDSLLRKGADTAALFSIFDELEFRNLRDRVMRRIQADPMASAPSTPVSEAAAAKEPTKSDSPLQGSLFDLLDEEDSAPEPTKENILEQPHTYSPVSDAAALELLKSEVAQAKEVGLTVLAPGEGDMNSTIIAFAVATTPGKAYFFEPSLQGACEWVLSLLCNPTVTVVSGAVKRDYVATHFSIYKSDKVMQTLSGYFDTAVAHYLLQPDMRHSTADLSDTYLNLLLPSIEEQLGRKGGPAERYAAVKKEALCDFVCAMADATLRLKEPLHEAILAQEGLDALFTDVEQPLISVLAEMEIAGMRVDEGALNTTAEELGDRLLGLEREIHTLAGKDFNVGSPAQVGEILFDHLALDPKAKKTKRGQYSTSEDILERLIPVHPIVAKILEFRQLKKLISTYLLALPACINPTTGKIHTTYNQTITATGRISSSDPNLQNIPIREGEGKELRRAFIADPGHIILSADYSQIELRLVADFASDPVMLKAFAEGTDIHTATAAKIYHKEVNEVNSDERRKAKTANFGILYGISAFGLANRLGIPRGEAKELIDGYFATFPTIREYMDKAIASAQECGFVSTLHKRRRMLPDINSRNPVVRGYAERNAINAPIQGSAADIIKIAMVDIANKIKELGLQSRMILQVHDELNFDALPEELPSLRKIVKECMEGAYTGKVVLTASMGEGLDWLTAH